MTRTVLTAVGGVLLAAFCLHVSQPARADGDLQGRELRPARDLDSGLDAVLGELLGGRKPPVGRIESVVVTEDRGDRLTVSVTCSGELDGRWVRGELQTKDHRSQRQLRRVQARLEDGGRTAELTFEPTGGVSEDLRESAYLRVEVEGGGVQNRTFTLGKVWGAESGSGDTGPARGATLVQVRARAEGRAKALPATAPTPSPILHVQPGVEFHTGGFRPVRPALVRDGRDRRPTPRGPAGDRRPTPVPVAPTPVQREAVLTRSATVLHALPQTKKIYSLDQNLHYFTVAEQNLGVRGPNANDRHDLMEVVQTDVTLEASQLLNVSSRLFRDQEPKTGYFYFLPETYHLEWLADRGRYDMAMLYLAATTPGTAGEVQMAAGLTAGVDPEEIRVAKALLDAYCYQTSCGVTPVLRSFPIDVGRVAVSFAGTLSLFKIPADKVVPVGLSSALADLRLVWSTDPVTKENLQLVLEQSGLDGSVTFTPPGTDQGGQLVPVHIKLADPGSFARLRWQRNQAWRNPTPYPVRVKYLHALVTDTGSKPTVYSWNLGGARVAPGGRVECDAREVPAWIDAKAVRMWVDYTVDEDCASCSQQALKDITGGVTSVSASQITFHTMNPIAEMGAYEVAVRVRSKRFDPEGRETTEMSVVLKADNQDFTVGPFYAGEAGRSSDVLFEYFLTVAMADGTEHEAQRWIPSRDLRVLIGRSQIEKALGFVPGGRPSDPPAPQ